MQGKLKVLIAYNHAIRTACTYLPPNNAKNYLHPNNFRIRLLTKYKCPNLNQMLMPLMH